MTLTQKLHAYLNSHPRPSTMRKSSAVVLPVVVIGLCKHGLYLTRNFSRQGVPVIAIVADLSAPSARTRYGYKIPCDDPNGSPLITTLHALMSALPPGTPIFPTNDKMVDVLIAHYAELSPHYRLPFPNGNLVTRLKDKATLDQLAAEAGLPVPHSHLINEPQDLARHQDAIQFPVAVKPTLPMSSFKSRRCDSLDELKAQVALSTALSEPLIVQEWIEGDDRAIVFGAYYIDQAGQCLAQYAGRKLMSYPSLTGHAAATESADIGERLAEGSKFLRDMGYWGLCSIEYKGTNPGNARFIEVTVGRGDWWIMCCGINGVDLPMAAYNALTGAGIPFSNKQTSKYVWHDIDHALPVLIENFAKGRWSARECLQYILRSKKDAIFDLRDLGPFLHSFPRYMLGPLRKIYKSLIKAPTLPTLGADRS